jgi:6-phosphofructokinase
MTQFKEAFIFLADGADSAERTYRETALNRTALVPVPDADTAAAVAAELHRDGLDLIELYGGFGPKAAAAVLAATGSEVPVGVVGVEEGDPARERAVIFLAPDADPAKDRYVHEHAGGRITIVAVPSAEAVPAAAEQLVREGVERLVICGGLGVLPAAAAIEAVGDRAQVGAVMFGFESLPGVASYRARFEEAAAAMQV